MSKYYYDPQNRLPYKKRLRNRCILAAIIILIFFQIGSCIFGGDDSEPNQVSVPEVNAEIESIPQQEPGIFEDDSTDNDSINIAITQKAVLAEVVPENAPVEERIDSTHIKNQSDLFLAEKIDNMLRRFKPMHSAVVVVDPNTNEIIAWGETKDYKVVNKPDYLIKNTFPAASLAKTVTIAAGFESNRYSLNTPIPMIGRAHHLYKNQLRVKENYTGPTMSLQDAYAKSANPPIALIGMNVGASRLKSAGKALGYNVVFPGGIPQKANYAPPDTGYHLAEVSCGFTEETTLSPLLAAAQVRSILMKAPLEIPWAKNLDGFAPKKRLALDVPKFSENTYYGLKESMVRSVTNGTARKQISSRNVARKNLGELIIGGKTGSLDGNDPHGRYEWFMGFAQSKTNSQKAIVVVVMQVHDLQGFRSQPATQVAAMIFNYWANKNLW